MSENSGAKASGRSSSQSVKAAAALSPIGTSLSLFPFPTTRTNPSSTYTCEISRPQSSLTRRPQP